MDEGWVLRIRFDLLSQSRDRFVHRASKRNFRISPHGSKQLVAFDHHVGPFRQVLQQLELTPAQRNRFAVPFRSEMSEVYRQAAEAETLDDWPGAPENGMNTGQQLLNINRLDDAIVGPRPKCSKYIGLSSTCGQDDDWKPVFVLPEQAKVEPALPGQHGAEKDQIGGKPIRSLHRLVAIGHMMYLEALIGQSGAQHVGKRRIVLDEKESPLHGIAFIASPAVGSPGGRF